LRITKTGIQEEADFCFPAFLPSSFLLLSGFLLYNRIEIWSHWRKIKLPGPSSPPRVNPRDPFLERGRHERSINT